MTPYLIQTICWVVGGIVVGLAVHHLVHHAVKRRFIRVRERRQ